MSKVILVFIQFLLCFTLFAQPCLPNGTPTSSGFAPPSVQLPCFQNNTSISQVVYFKNFTSFNIQPGVNLQVDSLFITDILNLPNGMNWQANKTPAKYLPGEHGCILLSGTVNDSLGQYKLKTYIRVHLRLGSTNFLIQGEGDSLAQSLGQGNIMRYYLRIIGNCGAPCPALDELTNELFVPYSPKPSSITASGDTIFCQGKNVTLTADTAEGYRYHWNTGDTTRSITVSSSGNYRVQVISNCDTSLSRIQYVIVKPMPVASVSLSSQSTNAQQIVIAQPSGASYQWILDSANDFSIVAGQITDTLKRPCGQVKAAVIVDALGCRDTSDYIKLYCYTGLEAINKEVFTLSPNPIQTSLSFSFSTHQNTSYSIEIFDVSGRTVYRSLHKMADELVTENIALSHLPKGVYHFLLRENNQVFSRSFIKD